MFFALRSTTALLAAALLLPASVSGLSSWYTVPGSNNPVGSTPGDKIRGVNLGGWFVLEPWMSPSLFDPTYTSGMPGTYDDWTVPDEWTFTSVLGRDNAQSVLENHWNTWITEDDFKRMADYGLNTVRLPVGHWAWNLTTLEEPYVGQGDQLQYIDRALNWSSVYGMDVIMDLHTVPGSQSGQENSGRYDDVQFSWNYTNLHRAVDAMRQMVAYTTQDKFNGVVKAFELVNEPYIEAYKSGSIPWDFLVDYLEAAYEAVRANEHIASGGNPSMVIIHDCFRPLSDWDYFFGGSGSDWINYAIDTHQYQAFSGYTSSDEQYIQTACGTRDYLATSQSKLPTMVGEFSLGTNTFCVKYKDCFGTNLEQALSKISSSNGDIDIFLRQFWEAQMGAYESGSAGWIFWNWKTELAPTWSYEQSVAQRWIPVDLNDKLYVYDSSQSYCLTNENYTNIPSFPATAEAISSGTHAVVGPPIKTQAVMPSNRNSTAVNATGTVAGSAGMTSARQTGSVTANISSSATAVPSSTSKSAGSIRVSRPSIMWTSELLLLMVVGSITIL